MQWRWRQGERACPCIREATKLPHLLKVQWKKTKAAIDAKVLVKNVISEMKHSNGTLWTIKVLNSLANDDVCIIGIITGNYNRAYCGFNHKVIVTDAIAETLCGIIKEVSKVVVN